jgi:carbon monoxide dehydrogenase subunit G
MSTTTVTRRIQAAPSLVFATISEIENFQRAIPGIVGVEILSEQRSGVGTRFKETRLMRGKEASAVLEVTECMTDERIRLVSDTHGAVWDSVFTVAPKGDGTLLTLSMETRSYKLMAKLLNPLMKGMVKKALEEDMDSVKQYCEAVSQG